jgi:transcriptional regulator with XRE-family HTH domain
VTYRGDVDDARVSLGRELRRLRKDTGLSQTAAGAAIGLKKSRVSEIERGEWSAGSEAAIENLIDVCASRLGPPADVAELRRKDIQALLAAVRTLDLAPTPATAPASGLPNDIRGFVGREGELSRAVGLTRRTRGVTVLAVDGRPGVGKTAFATRLGHRLDRKFPDPPIHRDLRGYTPGAEPLSAHEVLAGLLVEIGEPIDQIPDSLEERTSRWLRKSAGRQLLMVLDNALDATQVRPLLPGGQGSMVVVTSRQRLVDLGVQAATISLDVLSEQDSVRLLATESGLDLETAPLAEELARLCGYLPLTLVLVARRLRNRPAATLDNLDVLTYLRQFVNELGDEQRRLSLLDPTELDVDDVGLQAALELSYRALPTPLATLFQTLGLHVGPDINAFTAAALGQIQMRDAAGRLLGLHDHHLVDEPYFQRFGMHDLITQFARGRARSIPASAADRSVGQLLDHFRDAAMAADTLLSPFETPPPEPRPDLPPLTDRQGALAWFAYQRANLLTALKSDRHQPIREGETALALAQYLRLAGPWIVAQEVFDDALAHVGSDGDAGVLARLGLEAASASRNREDAFPFRS